MGNDLLQAAQQFVGQVVQSGADQKMINAPWKTAALNAIMSGDQAKGQELAENIMRSYGFSSPEDAIRQGIQNLSRRN